MTRARSNARGYTVVEVMSAMTLFAIGAAGVIGMQRVTIQGGNDARRFDVATNIANQWASRLQRDSMFWTQPNAANQQATNIGSTRYLSLISAPNTWVTPPAPTATNTESGAYDIFGRETPGASAVNVHMFCAQYRLQWIADPGVAGAFRPGALMRAEIRVVWARLDHAVIGDCQGLGTAPDPTKYHFVYLTTAIRQNPNQ